jgi:hypothetical protein
VLAISTVVQWTRAQPPYDRLDPVTITPDRYGGTYSRGAWLAFTLDPPKAPDGPFGSDIYAKLEQLKRAVTEYPVALANGQGRWHHELAVAAQLAHHGSMAATSSAQAACLGSRRRVPAQEPRCLILGAKWERGSSARCRQARPAAAAYCR